LIQKAENRDNACAFIGLQGREIKFHSLEDFPRMGDLENHRPKEQWWLTLRPIASVLAQPGPSAPPDTASAD
jgi:6-phosphofructokinase 1